MSADSIKPCGHHPDSGCTCRPPDPVEIVVTGTPTSPPRSAAQIHADLVALDGAVHQPLVDRAEELRRAASGDVASCRERGQHPRWSPASVQVVADLAELVRDLAKAVAER